MGGAKVKDSTRSRDTNRQGHLVHARPGPRVPRVQVIVAANKASGFNKQHAGQVLKKRLGFTSSRNTNKQGDTLNESERDSRRDMIR